MSSHETDSQVDISEKPAPLHIRILSWSSTYVGILKSIFAICLVWLLPSLKPETPIYHKMVHIRRRRRTRNCQSSVKTSVASSTSTLSSSTTENNARKAPEEVLFTEIKWDGPPKRPCREKRNSFFKVTAAAASGFNKPSLKAFARRISHSNKHLHADVVTSAPPSPIPAPEPIPTSPITPQGPTSPERHSLPSIRELQAAIDGGPLSNRIPSRGNLKGAFSRRTKSFFARRTMSREH